MEINKTYNIDCYEGAKMLPDKFVDCIVTSPPYYGLRDYGTATWVGGNPLCDHKGRPHQTRANINRNCVTVTDKKNAELTEVFKTICGKCGAIREDKQIGLEETPAQYIEKLVKLFRELRRALKDNGTLWINIGDSYAGSGRGAGDTKHTSAKQRSNVGSHVGDALRAYKDNTIKPKDLIGIPWMLAFALRADGWYLRQDIIWSKPNPMPESVTDRCTKSHEYIFLLTKSAKYYFDHTAIQQDAVTHEFRPAGVVRNREYDYDSKENNNPAAYRRRETIGGRKRKEIAPCDPMFRSKTNRDYEYNGKANRRGVWTIATKPYLDAHFATFPEELPLLCIKAGCPRSGIVLDPFSGSGTTGIVANKLARNYIAFELNPAYIEIENKRRHKELGIFQNLQAL